MKRKYIAARLGCLFLAVLLCCALCACAPLDAYSDYAETSGKGVSRIFGMVFLEIQTDSMAPTLRAGQTIRLREVTDPSALEVGDIISYWTVINGERVINTHRIVEIYDSGDHLLFVTKGDNNAEIDPLTVHESEIIGVYRG